MSGGDFVRLWPETASAFAGRVDAMVIAFTGIMLLFVLPVVVALLVFSFRYRDGTNVPRDHRPSGNIKVEISWIVLPFIAAMLLFVMSSRLFFEERTPPADVLEIHVTGKQWMWKFQHPGGQRELNTLHVPAERPVLLTMISEDLIHSFYVPALRLKQDLLPDRYTHMWFQADRPGVYQAFCAEYCGTDHSGMLAKLVVQTPQEYERWLAQADGSPSLAAQGQVLYRQFGCSGCHENGSVVHAPPLAGLYGKPVPLADGSTVTADDGYLRDSILLPQKQIAAGYPPIMPTFSNVLDEEAVIRLVAYIKSLGAATPPGAQESRQ